MAPSWRFLNFLLEPPKNDLQMAEIGTAEIRKWSKLRNRRGGAIYFRLMYIQPKNDSIAPAVRAVGGLLYTSAPHLIILLFL